MEQRTVKLYERGMSVPLKVVAGHFATNHSHVNYYIDMTTLKSRVSEASEIAKILAGKYIMNTVIDTIVCLDGMQVVGTLLAENLTMAGSHSINSHNTIYVVTPEFNSNSQLIFRDNLQPMIDGKHVLILMASVTTGITIRRSAECVSYYGGKVAGVAAIFSAVDDVEGYPIHSVFTRSVLPDYHSCAPQECPLCRDGQRIDALVNSYGYSKL